MNTLDEAPAINSKIYWDQRFEQDWASKHGPRQSRFFSTIAIDNLPHWLLAHIRHAQCTFADWGCAVGDGTAVWKEVLGANQITGIDFSASAIRQARQVYPALEFIQADWLHCDARATPRFDVLFSSNTLEHFHQPYEVLKKISLHAKRAIILALPYREIEPDAEHFFRFEAENIPTQLDNGFQLAWSQVIDCKAIEASPWQGEQIVLLYAEPDWIAQFGLRLADVSIAVNDSNVLVTEIAQYAIALDQQQQALTQFEDMMATMQSSLSQRDLQVENLREILKERDALLVTSDLQEKRDKEKIAILVEQVSEQDAQKNQQQSLIELHEREFEKALRELRYVQDELAKTQASTSWTVTAPLRFSKKFFQHPKKASYDFAKEVFWRLPPAVRQSLHGPRHSFVRWTRGSQAERTGNTPARTGFETTMPLTAASDLSWQEFSEHVLSQRHTYKGIFVQEQVIDWNVPLYQRPQHIACAFGRLGYLVIYKTDNWTADDVQGFREVAPNVWLSDRYEVDQIQDVNRSLYSTAYANTPAVIAEKSKRGNLIYEYIDHIDPQISGDEENVRRLLKQQEFAFNGGADFVVASARKLEQEAIAAVGVEKVILAQNGVDTRHYRDPIHLSTPLPEKLIQFRAQHKKVVGYFGALAPWLWYEAITELVANRPDLAFIFIGPDYYGGALQLPQADNLLYLGTVDYQVLPAYARQFDICFIPFSPGEIARTTSPLKLFEYFALEKPVVVSSDMAECVAFPEVFSGDSSASLAQAIDDAFAIKDEPAFKTRLGALADANDWDCRALAMEKAFVNYADRRAK